MKKRMVCGLIALVFVCSSLFIMTSCAKKQIGVSERVEKPVIVEEEKVVVVEEEEKAPVAEEKVVVVVEEEKAEMLAAKIREFDTENIYFAFDKSDLRHKARATLKKKAAFLRGDFSFRVLIAGNCDERGTEAYNLALGERRAHSAKKYLMALGISGDRISTVSYGEERPADPAHTPAAWELNRRDTFTLLR
ncbi:MAG: OmpA family protein [Desulfatiglandaceae bacterium]